MRPTPAGWPRITASLAYDDAAAAIDFLCAAFGFEVQVRVEDDAGRIQHSQLGFGDDGLIMVGQAGGGSHRTERLPTVSPAQTGRMNTQTLCVFVDDVDAFCARAVGAGAVLASPPSTTDHGPEYWCDRSAQLVDLEGHAWWFIQRLRG